MTYDIHLKRVYDAADQTEGARVLVDRLWPRGKRKTDLMLSQWYKEAAPSSGLRRAWHRGDVSRDEFTSCYQQELDSNSDVLVPLMRLARQDRLTLLTATKDIEQSHLPILQQALLHALEKEDREADGTEPSSPVCFRE